MFDFEKLDVYQVTKEQNVKVLLFMQGARDIDRNILKLWKKATLAILLNLTEGTGQMNDPDKRRFLTMARGSVFESVAMLDLLKSLQSIPQDTYQEFYTRYEQISKMLLGMYRSYTKEK